MDANHIYLLQGFNTKGQSLQKNGLFFLYPDKNCLKELQGNLIVFRLPDAREGTATQPYLYISSKLCTLIEISDLLGVYLLVFLPV